MEDSWSRDSRSKWQGHRPQPDHPNHGQAPRGAGADQEQGSDAVRVWAQSEVPSNSAALIDDTIGQFGNLTLGEAVASGGTEIPRAGATGQVVMEGLDMASLRIEGDAAQPRGGQKNHFPVTSQEMVASGAPLEWGSQHQHHQSRQDAVAVGMGGFPFVGGCSSCGRGQQGNGGGRGQDGVWRDEQGRRMFTEEEVREAIEQESRSWRDKSAALAAQLAKIENEAREALMRADQAMAEMAEKLRMSESKTYALSVHLAKSNRPPHVA